MRWGEVGLEGDGRWDGSVAVLREDVWEGLEVASWRCCKKEASWHLPPLRTSGQQTHPRHHLPVTLNPISVGAYPQCRCNDPQVHTSALTCPAALALRCWTQSWREPSPPLHPPGLEKNTNEWRRRASQGGRQKNRQQAAQQGQ